MARGEDVRGAKDEDKPFLFDALRQIALIRAFEGKAQAYTEAKPPLIAGSVHLCPGQEAVPVGTCAALRPGDKVIATYRGHGWAIASGEDPRALFAELCHRDAGINGGRAGSALMMGSGDLFVGENSIVGAGIPMGCGLALTAKLRGDGGVVVASIGDGAMSQGAVHEGMVFAAAYNLPLIIICENNDWSELTPTKDLLKIDRLASRARAYGMTSATIDGTDPVAVRDTILQAAAAARSGSGPVLIEAMVPRLWGHYSADIEHYRSKEDKADAAHRDPLAKLSARIRNADFATETDVAQIIDEQSASIERIANEVLELPFPSADTALTHLIDRNIEERGFDAPQPAKTMTYADALNSALREALADDRTILFGEDVARPGGVFGVTRRLQQEFGQERVFDTPIAETAMIGSAVGAAMAGSRPIVEIMWADFLFVALDQLVNQAANIRYISRGRMSAPMVLRTQQGTAPGSCAQHSQSVEAILAHIPGIKVALPSTPQDAYDLLRLAHADPDPCVLIEGRTLYRVQDDVVIGGDLSRGQGAALRARGTDIGIISWGTMAPKAVEAAQLLQAEGIAPSVLDLRWLAPLDIDAIRALIAHCGGRVLIVHEDVRTGGFGAEIFARLHELGSEMDVPIRVERLACADTRIPAAPNLLAALIPSVNDIANAARAMLA